MRKRTTSQLTVSSLAKVLLLACFAAIPGISHADTFDDQAAFDDATCGEFINDELDFGQELTTLLDVVLPTSWGVFDYSGPGFTNNFGVVFDPENSADGGLLISDEPAALIPDPTLGSIEGLAITYIGSAGSEGLLCVVLEDGSSIEVPVPATADSSDETLPLEQTPVFFGWTNTTGQEVVDVSIKAIDTSVAGNEEFLIVYSIGFSFGEVCDTAPTCQGQLQDIIDALNVKLDSASEDDQFWIENAIYELECAQNPALWETEDRLSNYGCVFFGNNFYATYFLECVADDDLVEDCLIGIQDLLGCVVDAEIAFALLNPDANSNLVAYAEYFEEYADAFAEAEMYLNAVILHFYAWLFANNA